MLVFVLNKHNEQLMPCKPQKARKLLLEGKAKVVRRTPFTIQLLYGCSGYTQSTTLGIDPGYQYIGISVVTKKKELYAAEIELRSRDIVKRLSEKRQYRKGRRYRNTRYRKPRFLNRKKQSGWLSPSHRHRLNSIIRVIDQVGKLLPIHKIAVEVAAFDIQKIKDPNVKEKDYQEGPLKGFYNTREFVLHRDSHTCQYCKQTSFKKRKPERFILQVHHIESRQTGGNRPDNLITLCSKCHDMIHKNNIELKIKPSKAFKAETSMNIIRWQLINKLKSRGYLVSHTYGYITKKKRIDLNIQKSHTNDAFVIAGGKKQVRSKILYIKQNRQNNRCLQLNRKGFKPSIRKQKYKYQPGDLVKFKDSICKVKGVFNYGKWIRILQDNGQISNVAIHKVRLLKFQRGFTYGY